LNHLSTVITSPDLRPTPCSTGFLSSAVWLLRPCRRLLGPPPSLPCARRCTRSPLS